jgi:NitT/TauT family transport system permease protein
MPTPVATRRDRLALPHWLLWLIALAGGVLTWHLLRRGNVVPDYMLPSPSAVWHEWWRLWGNGVMQRDLKTTLAEALSGFAVAFAVGVGLGMALARTRMLSGLVSPFVAASQAMPIIAFAPLLVVWFGFGLLPKTIICALIVFFPILVNTESGLRSVDRDLIEASWTMGAGPWQTLWYIEIPLALRPLLAGVRMGLTLAITGAVVGEFVAASAGLGYLMNYGRTLYNAPMVFAASITMALVAMAGYALVSALERLLITWE